MKSHKPFLATLLIVVVAVSAFFVSPATGYAQTDGQGWTDPINLSLSGAATNPILVVDLTGTVHAIWIDNFDKGYKYSNSSDGKTWAPPQTVNFPFSSKYPPPIFILDPNGIIHVFWISGSGELLYAQATPSALGSPKDWKITTSLGTGVLSFDATLDSHNILNVAYVKKSSTSAAVDPAGVYFRQSVLGGGSWSPAVALYTSEYFRSATQNNSYIRISTAEFQGNEHIYVTWDNRVQKRVFMASSADAGVTWDSAQQIKGPEDTGGVYSPFNLTVGATANNVLLIWEVGNLGASACTVYSQWSVDGGKNWGDPVAVLGGRSECPVSVQVVDKNEQYISVMLVGQVKPILLAWNGKTWSNSQIPTQLPLISNPLTLDNVMLGCRFDFYTKQRLYVTGCDLGENGDVWYLSRPLEPVESWFSSLSFWTEADIPSLKLKQPSQSSNFSSAADNTGNVHLMWTESLVDNNGISANSIEYARWDGKQWTNPVSILKSLSGMPVQLAVTADSIGRFHVTWVDSYNGDLLYSWANVEKAGLASEWADIAGVSPPSSLISSPDSTVDGSGRIVIAYAVPLNEGRGIYVAQSTDNGSSWSAPIRVFDAVTEGWERIDNPKLSLGSDGILHLIFIRQTIRTKQATGLYYSRSTDGGLTWSAPQIISKANIQWANIASYDARTVHVVWQEYDGLVYANVSQVSQDSGETWGKSNNITGVNDEPTHVALASDGRGLLHFIQLVKKAGSPTINQQTLVLQDWKWDGNAWSPEASNDVTIQGAGVTYSLSADISSAGSLCVVIPAEYTDPVAGTKDHILFFYRNLDKADTGQTSPKAGILPALATDNDGNSVTVLQPTPTTVPDLPVLHDNTASVLSSQKTIVGLVLVGVIVLTLMILFNWRSLGNKEK